jgi:TonB family protein
MKRATGVVALVWAAGCALSVAAAPPINNDWKRQSLKPGAEAERAAKEAKIDSYDAEFPAGLSPTANLNEQVLTLPGDPARPVNLVVTIMKPDGPGPFPLAVVNHGIQTTTYLAAQQQRYRKTYQALYFLSRGYAVALPMMRGFAGSGGHIASYGCNAGQAGMENAKDLSAVIQSMARQPYVDAGRVVISGISRGGWNTLAAGSLNLPGVRALVNFAGDYVENDCKDTYAAVTSGAAAFGARTSAPSIWFYAGSDKQLDQRTWRDMHDRYVQAGGKAELVDLGLFGSSTVQMLSASSGLKSWTPKVDALLVSVGLPSRLVNEGYLPALAQTPAPLTTNPDWLRKPTAADYRAAFPAKAASQGVARGRVVLNCTVTTEGLLGGCAVASEDPASGNFGEAALRIASLYQMRPQTADGRSLRGVKVTMPMTFINPTVPVAPAMPTTTH